MKTLNLNEPAIGIRIRCARRRMHLSQEELAELSGLSRQTISYIETGRKKAGAKALISIASALHLPLESLFSLPAEDDTFFQLLDICNQCSQKEKNLILALVTTVFSILREQGYIGNEG